MKAAAVLAFLVGMALAVPVGEADEFRRPTVAEFEQALATLDLARIGKVVGLAYVRTGRDPLDRLLVDLWLKNEAKRPDLPWDIVKSPQVRVRLFYIIAQAARDGSVEIGREELRDEAWVLASSPDRAVVRRALETLGILDDPADVVKLEEYLETAEFETFGGYYGAVLALARMCNDAASAALDRLESAETDPKRIEIIRDLRAQWHPQKREYGFCR